MSCLICIDEKEMEVLKGMIEDCKMVDADEIIPPQYSRLVGVLDYKIRLEEHKESLRQQVVPKIAEDGAAE